MSQLKIIKFSISDVSLRNVKHPGLYYTISIPGKEPTPLYKSATITSRSSNPAWKKEAFHYTHRIYDLSDTRNRITIEIHSEEDNAFIGSVTVPINSLLAEPKRKMYRIMHGMYPDSKLVFEFAYSSALNPVFILENPDFKVLSEGTKIEWRNSIEINGVKHSLLPYSPKPLTNAAEATMKYSAEVKGLARDDLLSTDLEFCYTELLPGHESCTRHTASNYMRDHKFTYRVSAEELEYDPVRIGLRLRDENASLSGTLYIVDLGGRIAPPMGSGGIVQGSVKTAPGRFRDDKFGFGDEYIERYDKAGKKYFLNILTGESKYPN